MGEPLREGNRCARPRHHLASSLPCLVPRRVVTWFERDLHAFHKRDISLILVFDGDAGLRRRRLQVLGVLGEAQVRNRHEARVSLGTTHARTHAHAHARVHVHTHTHTRALRGTHARTHTTRTHARTHTRTQARTHAHTHTYTHAHPTCTQKHTSFNLSHR